MARKFVAKTARFEKGVIYTGASAGIFDPGTIAQAVLGEVNWGELMGYAYRRFGPPNAGSDPYKGLADWRITTPVPGLFLSIQIGPYGTQHLFGYIMAGDLEKRLSEIEFSRRKEVQQRWQAWCIQAKGSALLSPYDDPACSYGSAEFERRRAIMNAWWAEFEASDAHNAPSEVDNTEFERAEDALKAAIEDLKRPVMVRDVAINAFGRTDDERGAVKPFQGAGYFTPPELLDDPKLWGQLIGSILNLGRGKTGVRKALEAIRSAG